MSNITKIHHLHEISLDQLWHEAESLGVIEIDRSSYPDDAPYVCEIKFRRKTGTRITAVGRDRSIHFALAAAINEAREMGAGVIQ